MGGISNFGRCCNRIIVSRQWRYCPFCGGPRLNGDKVENANNYVQLGEVLSCRDEEIDYLRGQLHDVSMLQKGGKDVLMAQEDEIIVLRQAVKNLESLVALRVTEETSEDGPRAPDIVIVDAGTPGVSGGLATVQEACSAISLRGVNKDKPCIRPAEPNQKHATGRHRY